ncbi:hypothetical protein [Sinomicrobium weinanense]|uniref:DUF4179 domain-containing protein n=1 Tax=Sinomicrobium weinanense TaxID=2842200 RepID=A0A926Q2L4_9FLAO|nr:hypothetical protein [Sinomicrobium weinanense]MBC9795969.1 hypothetical protein [Sinomicrobium weinanense]MBU3122088.1 hypothetical protein [Sinomicrobium weinanense]
MMKKDNIDNLFERLQGEFDTESPAAGHENRFLEKLVLSKAEVAAERQKDPQKKRSSRLRWRQLSVAASIVLLLGLGWVFYNTQPQSSIPVEAEEEVAYPELEKTRYYFASLIETELKNIREEATTEDTRIIVDDAVEQLNLIEKDYEKLEAELQKNGYSKQLLNAMITNFQTRVALLQSVMEQIENMKRLKNDDHEANRL